MDLNTIHFTGRIPSHRLTMAMRVLTRAMTMRRLQSPLVRALSTDVHAPTSLSAAVSETTDAGKSSDGDMDTLASVPIAQVLTGCNSKKALFLGCKKTT